MCVGVETEELGCVWNITSVPEVFALKYHPEAFTDGKNTIQL